MNLFRTKREKQLWLFTLLVIVAIFLTLLIGQPLQELFANQDFQAALFWLVMLLTAVLIIYNGLKTKSGNYIIGVYIGLFAVYIMLFLRLGLSERSHLIEYSVLAIFIYQAFTERYKNDLKSFKAAFFAAVLGCSIGILDETMQLFIPDRVFDTNDILFNCLAVLGAIGSSMFLQWVRIRIKKR